ncbi:hypothetical protein J4E85_008559 [Alternaria conjuncta]|uniref:uncharacterized protein n=1 Tax=Alternaria conjuncta TaxID=181017 RepID=UPI0022205DF4|nr:uncharacterized protein J4E85_008559 [Alternaria conjuncta]KAI4923520.1 hypothetical protein J4E85_008559 [Alternaria conjuncta]
MDGLKEREPSRAGDLYTAEIGQAVNTVNHQRNAVKLIMARWSAVDPIHYPIILGVSQNDSKSKDVNAVVSMVNTMQTSWIGQSSWVQGYIKGETDWHDLQAHINNLNRFRLLLKVPQANETPAQRTTRRDLQRAYKKAVRIHVAHTQTAAAAELAEVEEEFDDAVEKGEATQTELQEMQDRIQHLTEYQGGLTATNNGPCRNLADVPAVEPYYSQMANNAKFTFWEARWNQDVFVSFLWEFSGVLHYKQNWNDILLRTMFRKKFFWLADVVSQYILEPLKATAVCQSSATRSLVRSSLEFPDNKALAYAEFKRADSLLYPPDHANPPGSHMILWVQGAPSQKMRTRKRARETDGDEEEGRGMANFLRDME